MDADSQVWLGMLTSAGPEREDAVGRLHTMLLRVARNELHRRGGRLRIQGPELDDLAQQAADDAVVAVLKKVGEFRGDSRFTTWAYKFAVFEVSTAVGRHFWRDAPIRLDAEDWERLPDRLGVDPVLRSEAQVLAAALHSAVDTALTARQRRVFVAIVLDEIPLDALVLDLGSNRNAIYKTLFDARRKLRTVLAAQGYLDPDHDTVRQP